MIEELEDVVFVSDDWSSKTPAASPPFDEMLSATSYSKASSKPVDPSSQQWGPDHYQLQKELARSVPNAAELSSDTQATTAGPVRKGSGGSASEADAEADRRGSISVNPALLRAELAEPITVTRATSSSVPHLGPTFAAEIKVLNSKEQHLQQHLVELQSKMEDLTGTITRKKDTIATLRHQLELIRGQLEVHDASLQEDMQLQEGLLEKQDMLSREYHSVLMQKQELLYPAGSPLMRVKRKRSPSMSPVTSPPSSPTQSKKLRMTPCGDEPGDPVSGLAVAQFPAKKGLTGMEDSSEGMEEQRATLPADRGATPERKPVEQEGGQEDNPAKQDDKLPAEQDLGEQSLQLPNTGCLELPGPLKPKEGQTSTGQSAVLLVHIKEEKTDSPDRTRGRAMVTSLESSEQGGDGGARAGPVIFSRHSSSVLSLKTADSRLFTCSSDKSVRVYNVQTGQILNNFSNHQKSVTCLEIYDSVGGTSYLLSGSSDKTICMYNIETGVLSAQFRCGSRVMFMGIQRSLLFVGLSSAVVIAIDLEKKESVGKKLCHTGVNTEENPSISCLCSNDEFLFTAAFDKKVHCWNIKEGLLSRFTDPKFDSIPQVHVLTCFSNTVLCMKIHQNHLYCGSADCSLQVHNIKTWEREHHITCHSGAVSGIQVLGKLLVTACFDKYIRCFDLEKMELVQVYGGNSDMVFTVCMSKNVVYTGSKDGAVKACPIDLTVYYQCQWNNCKLRFGLSDHLSEHMRDHLGVPDGSTVQKCQWENCTQTVSSSAMLSHLHNHCVRVQATKL